MEIAWCHYGYLTATANVSSRRLLDILESENTPKPRKFRPPVIGSIALRDMNSSLEIDDNYSPDLRKSVRKSTNREIGIFAVQKLSIITRAQYRDTLLAYGDLINLEPTFDRQVGSFRMGDKSTARLYEGATLEANLTDLENYPILRVTCKSEIGEEEY